VKQITKINYDNTTFTNNNDFNQYLLYKFLKIEYIKNSFPPQEADKATQELILKHKDNLFGKNSLSQSLAERSFTYFCTYYLQDTFVPKDSNKSRNLAPVHYEIWNQLQQMFIDDKWNKEEFILPRGSSKSTIINKSLSCYLHCTKRSIYTIVIGNKEDDAVQFISDTKIMLGNEFIKRTYGNLIDTKTRTVNKQELELTNNTKISAFSFGSSVRGTTYSSVEGISRPSTIILDDVISEDDILSDNAKEKVITKFYKEIAEVGDEAVFRDKEKIKSSSKFLIIGTPLAQDDFINTIKNDVTFKVFHRKVVNFDIDQYFEENEYWQEYKTLLFNDKLDKEIKDSLLEEYYNNNIAAMTFPTIWEKYDCAKLAQKYFSARNAFLTELMCECQNMGEKWFKSNRVQSINELTNISYTKTMLCIDPAGIKNKNVSRADYFAFVVGSLSENDFLYIRLGEILKFKTFDEYLDHAIKIITNDKLISTVYVEKNTYLGWDCEKLQELINNKLPDRSITIINEMQNKNKDSKISTVCDNINNGRIIFCKETVMPEAIAQMMDFQGQLLTLHDDFIDAVAECSIRIRNITTYHKPKFLDRRLLF